MLISNCTFNKGKFDSQMRLVMESRKIGAILVDVILMLVMMM